jgi:DNA topoisomerase-1
MSGKYPISRNVTKIKLGKNKFKYSFKYKWKNGKIITDKTTLQRINTLHIPPAYKDVNIFSNSAKTQYMALDDKKRVQKGYHPTWVVERNRKKFRDLIEFVKAYPKITRKINTILSSTGPPKTKEQMVALATGLLDVCRIRPGSDKHLRDTGSYGTTTLCKKHIKKKTLSGKTYISLKFVGKSGVTNDCVLKSNTKIAKNLYSLAQTRNRENSPIFITKDYKVTGNCINNFLQDIGGNYISGKSFRTYHANIAF